MGQVERQVVFESEGKADYYTAKRELSYLTAISYLSYGLKNVLSLVSLDVAKAVQEIRLRVNSPVSLSCKGESFYISKNGTAVTNYGENLFVCNSNDIKESFLKICGNSVHSHGEEIKNGFVTTPDGYRVGIAGTAVFHTAAASKEIATLRDITSLCIRVARNHKGCSKQLLPGIIFRDKVISSLICGEPSSGKTSLLRDLAYQLSLSANFRVSVVDERGELGFNSGENSYSYVGFDLLRFYPKHIGVEQCLRSLAPQVIIFDELGNSHEVKAVIQSLNSGVSVISSAHCRDEKELFRRPQLVQAIKSGAFEQVVFLKGRGYPGEVREIVKAGDLVC